METTAPVSAVPAANAVEKEKMQQRMFRRDNKCKRRVYKQQGRYEQENKVNTFENLQPGPWLALVAEYTLHHHSSEREGQVVVGFTKRRKPKGRQLKTKSSAKDGLLGRNVCVINNWFFMSPKPPNGK